MDRITFTDENGNEVELEILSMAQYEGQTYILVTDQQAEDEEEIDVFIMREDDVRGEDAFYSIVDPEEESDEFVSALLDILEDNIPEEDDEDDDYE